MLLVQLVLVAWLVVAGLSLLAPSPGVALVLMAISAVWLPVNNGHLEGPVLYRADVHHGLTVADLLTYLGFALCVLAGLRWRRFRLRSRGPGGALGPAAAAAFVAVLLVLLAVGLAASWLRGQGGTS